MYVIKNRDGDFSTGGMHPTFTNKVGEFWLSKASLRDYLFSYCKYWFDELRGRPSFAPLAGDQHCDARDWVSCAYYPTTLIERLEEDDGWVVEQLDTGKITPVKEFYLEDGMPSHPMITYTVSWKRMVNEAGKKNYTTEVRTTTGPIAAVPTTKAYIIHTFQGEPLSEILQTPSEVVKFIEDFVDDTELILDLIFAGGICLTSSETRSDGDYVPMHEILDHWNIKNAWLITELGSAQTLDLQSFYMKHAGFKDTFEWRSSEKDKFIFIPKELANSRWEEEKRKDSE